MRYELWQWHEKTADGEQAIIKKADDWLVSDQESILAQAEEIRKNGMRRITTIAQAANYFLRNESGSVSQLDDDGNKIDWDYFDAEY